MYDEILHTCRFYLGPASEGFIQRQCTLFLKVEPQKLERAHLAELVSCVEVSGLRFMEEAKVKELAGRLSRL